MPPADHDASPREVRLFVLVQLGLTAVFMALLTWMVGGIDGDLPPIWLCVLLLVPVPVAAFVAERVWQRTEPLAADAEHPAEEAVDVFAAQTMRKLVICEVPILIGVVVGFVADHGGWPVLIAGLPGLAVLAFETWPSARNLSLTQTGLEVGGVDSGLLESFES